MLGLVIGVFMTGRSMASLMNDGSAASTLATITVQGATLERIAAGDVQGAQQRLHLNLDGQLIALRYAVDGGYTLPPGAVEKIAKLEQLRQSSGYVPSNAEVREAVEAAFDVLVRKR